MYVTDLEFLNEELSIYLDSGGFREGYGLFFKGLHVKDQLMGFMYYKTNSNSGLKMKIGYIDPSSQFKEKFSHEFSSYSFYTEEILNDFIKINDERLAYLGVIVNEPTKFKILLIDLYNNYQNLIIRAFNIELENYKINTEIVLSIYNNYLVLSSTVTNKNVENMSKNKDLYFSILTIFGYVNETDDSINISDYLKDDYINGENNLISKFTRNIQIDNNIFEYYIITDQIKLSSIPNEVLFYNNDNIKKLSNNDILKEKYNFKQNTSLIKTNNLYSIDYQIILK